MHQDAEAALQYAITSCEPFSLAQKASSLSRPLKVVIWGQSIGCAFASHLAAGMVEIKSSHPNVELETLILETPFTSASKMLQTLYPQKWLPYRYLSVFLWNRLDTVSALERVKTALDGSERRLDVVMLEGGKDELVPREHGDEIEALCKNDLEGSSPKQAVMGHHNTLKVMSCAPKPSPRTLVVQKQAPHPEVGRRLDRGEIGLSSSYKPLLLEKDAGTTVSGLGGLAFKRVTVEGALHTQVLAKGSGRIAAAKAVRGHGDGTV